jgi:hypothetical protein
MVSIPPHPASARPGDSSLPLCTEALWAGTLALMTRYAEPGDAALRPLIACKIVSNLECLARHPDLPRPLCCVVRRARDRWVRLADVSVPRH